MKTAHTALTHSTVQENAAAPHTATAGYVMLLLIIPGLDHVSVGCAMLMGRLLQETVDRALADEGLFCAEPSYFQSKVAALQKATVARLKGLKAAQMEGLPAAAAPGRISESMDAKIASNRFIADVAERMYGGSLISFVRNQDRLYFGFSVSNLGGGSAGG